MANTASSRSLETDAAKPGAILAEVQLSYFSLKVNSIKIKTIN